MTPYAEILSLDEFVDLSRGLGKVVCASGGFDPLHPGHATYLVESRKYGDALVVVVKGDHFLTLKKGRPFQDLQTRCMTVACIRNVDYVIPFEIEDDSTIHVALEKIRPTVYTKGWGYSNQRSVAEWDLCARLGIQLVVGVGMQKQWSSSHMLRDWAEYWWQHTHPQHDSGVD